MKQTVLSLILLFFTGALSITACKKDEKSAEEYLVAASCWKVSKVEALNPLTNTWEDVTEDTLDDCDLDDCIKFNSDKTVVVNLGTLKCDLSDPDEYETGTWNISSDGKTLTVADDVDAQIFSIIEITSNRMVGELTDNSTGIKIRFIFSN